MLRLLSAVFAASVTLSAAAYAADPHMIVVPVTNPSATHAKIVAAAKKLCASAVTHDPFDEFGTSEECIENSVHGAYYVHPTEEALSKTLAQRSN